jgi:hypothetical protein
VLVPGLVPGDVVLWGAGAERAAATEALERRAGVVAVKMAWARAKETLAEMLAAREQVLAACVDLFLSFLGITHIKSKVGRVCDCSLLGGGGGGAPVGRGIRGGWEGGGGCCGGDGGVSAVS